MKLSEILEHLAADVLDDRADLVEGEPDSIWKASTLVRYLSQAERMLCKQAWVLQDQTTPEVCEIQLVAGTDKYAVHKSVLFVQAVRLSDSDVDMKRLSYDNLRPRGSFDESLGAFGSSTQYVTAPGRPHSWTTDRPYRTIYLRDKPDAASALLKLRLKVTRMPLVELTVDDLEASPEIPEEYHLDMCDWAAYKALSQPNVDGEARAAAREYRDAFKQTVKDASLQVHIAEFGPGTFRFGGWAGHDD